MAEQLQPFEALEVDLYSPEIEEFLRESGQLYRRRIEPLLSVRFPESPEQIDTIIDGAVETSTLALPGKHMAITGKKGEEYVVATSQIGALYDLVPRERLMIGLPNPYGQSIKILAPWSTPDKPQYQEGTESAILAFNLDESGDLTSDRYIIGDPELLNANYETVDVESETKKKQEAALKLLRIWHGFTGHPGKDVHWDNPEGAATCRCGCSFTRADLYF
jgi:hypothetical protein